MIPTKAFSPKRYARIAGALYLVNITLGFFSIGYVPNLIIVDNDAAATANNILSHEFLYRAAIVAHLIILLTNIPLAVIFLRLFKVVNKNVTLLFVFFTLVPTAIEAAGLVTQFRPLLLLKDPTLQNSFTTAQLQSLSLETLRLQTLGFNLGLVFFGFYGICAGYLIIKSTFLPKGIGVFMLIGGLCYLLNSFSLFLAPGFAAQLVPYVQIPSGLAELSFCLWMLIAGVNVTRWKEKAMNQE